MFDFNDATPQISGDLIPAKTYAKVIAAIRPGKGTADMWITKSASEFEYLNMEFTVVSAPMAKRKIFQNAGVGGVTDGHEKAANITRSFIRAMLESARGIDPKDESEKAQKARRIQSWGDLVELEFAVEVGIEKGKDGYDDKNKIQRVLLPGHAMYTKVMAGETILPGGDKPSSTVPPVATNSSPVASAVPEWAR